jgi:hypothetical protein
MPALELAPLPWPVIQGDSILQLLAAQDAQSILSVRACAGHIAICFGALSSGRFCVCTLDAVPSANNKCRGSPTTLPGSVFARQTKRVVDMLFVPEHSTATGGVRLIIIQEDGVASMWEWSSTLYAWHYLNQCSLPSSAPTGTTVTAAGYCRQRRMLVWTEAAVDGAAARMCHRKLSFETHPAAATEIVVGCVTSMPLAGTAAMLVGETGVWLVGDAVRFFSHSSGSLEERAAPSTAAVCAVHLDVARGTLYALGADGTLAAHEEGGGHSSSGGGGGGRGRVLCRLGGRAGLGGGGARPAAFVVHGPLVAVLSDDMVCTVFSRRGQRLDDLDLYSHLRPPRQPRRAYRHGCGFWAAGGAATSGVATGGAAAGGAAGLLGVWLPTGLHALVLPSALECVQVAATGADLDTLAAPRPTAGVGGARGDGGDAAVRAHASRVAHAMRACERHGAAMAPQRRKLLLDLACTHRPLASSAGPGGCGGCSGGAAAAATAAAAAARQRGCGGRHPNRLRTVGHPARQPEALHVAPGRCTQCTRVQPAGAAGTAAAPAP